MKNIFNSVKMSNVDTNVFDMSYDVKLSLNMGDLIPIHCQEVIPGDVFKNSTESLLRFAPLIAPVMHKVDVYTHSFFVPNRLVWDKWESFITGQELNPNLQWAAPYIPNLDVTEGSLGDYLGLPIGVLDKVSAIPYSAYALIWNEYYKDQNLNTFQYTPLTSGSNAAGTIPFLNPAKRAWQHDYFTAALPFAQKGDSVQIPLGNVQLRPGSNSQGQIVRDTTSAQNVLVGALSGGNSAGTVGQLEVAGGADAVIDPNGTLQVGATSINDLRKAFRLQEWLEKNARSGTRYVESILAHFGVKSSDARLNRPEYLGGSQQPMIISEVLQTSATTTSPQGNMAGHGVSVGGGKEFTYRAEEHGYIITIMSVLPQTAYQQGIPRNWSKFDRLDYFWPSFANLGEQEVKNRELYYNAADSQAVNDATFGYVPRYAEYKYNNNRVAGDFRTSLSFWHLGRIFASRPVLNNNFVSSDPTHRAFAVTDPTLDKIYAHVFHRIKATRKMPKYGTPTF